MKMCFYVKISLMFMISYTTCKIARSIHVTCQGIDQTVMNFSIGPNSEDGEALAEKNAYLGTETIT